MGPKKMLWRNDFGRVTPQKKIISEGRSDGWNKVYPIHRSLRFPRTTSLSLTQWIESLCSTRNPVLFGIEALKVASASATGPQVHGVKPCCSAWDVSHHGGSSQETDMFEHASKCLKLTNWQTDKMCQKHPVALLLKSDKATKLQRDSVLLRTPRLFLKAELQPEWVCFVTHSPTEVY